MLFPLAIAAPDRYLVWLMGYEVLARKWRPQVFADVVGQDHVTKTLHNAIQTERLAHAYLFVGPRGTGKTTTARILAKALNCQNRQGSEPCNECDSCKEIMTGSSLDVIEIDGASNRGIADVQELRDNVRYAPVRGPFKIYIIDEVHMLTREAFNAILKTLEEPPAHVKFFFATTEPQKVLTTILSRCQRFDLRRISVADITGQLQKISKAEGININNDALLAISRGAEGGLRDAESALDQLVSFRGKDIEEADVLSVFGLISREQLEGLATGILTGNIPVILGAVAAIDSSGKDMQRVVLELLDHFRNLLIVMHAGKDLETFDIPSTQIDILKQQAEKTSDGRLLRIIDLLIEADGRMRYALSKRTLLEAALIRASRAATVATVDELMQQVAALKGREGATAVKETATTDYSVKKKPCDDLNRLKSAWPQLIERFTKALPQAHQYLIDTAPIKATETHVTIGIDPEFAQEKESLENQRTIALVQKTLEGFLNRPVSVNFQTLEGTAANKPLPTDRPAKQGLNKKDYKNNPAVRSVLEHFSGDIEDVRK
ncbi:DNA polymerase III subunit gamma/tau [Tichowtungia aerotolerans]|uniref:DNA polymerase III subunit gamma/tau n=1 Tax=Tichowtungia aerotolerans TaxID=2697043 RepID=A0A6P1M894_9BACT|nr:DNA polymerase III subunit gamma/tau [Tichowtungia aerotolerans]QHI70262.1 DNA polymerase III subunit gamma/tau [Tichowtungia aerotolerans]